MAETKDLLFEIGCEEIPARFLPGAIKQMENLAAAALKEQGLAYESLRILATPRRLTLLVSALALRQPDRISEQKGPSVKSAYDAEGQPTRALEGFCKSQGLKPEELFEKEISGNVYLFAKKHQPGKDAVEVLPPMLLQIIQKLHFPKPMRWGYEEMRFARPIRWLVALLGEEVLPLEIAEVKAGRLTRGHRVLGSQAIEISKPAAYEGLLLENGVMADQNKRRQEAWKQAQELAASLGCRVEEDEELLEEVTYLLEYPTALAGSFEEEYLNIPQELVITPMKEHQRYFPVYNQEGALVNRFITLRNGDNRFLDVVTAGNEKVLKARLADAEFFWQEDIKETLSDWVEKLDAIVFHEKLGSLGQKVARIRRLGAWAGQALAYTEAEQQLADRTIFLMKGDLLSRVVFEFPELQGIMGEYYARKDKEDDQVAQGIREHYLPRFAGDTLPKTKAGKLAALCEKTDSLVGFFAAGMQPTGSQDPYALRRAGTGIVQIILGHSLDLSLTELLGHSYDLYQKEGFALTAGKEETLAAVSDFLGHRLENILQEQGVSYDVVNAVLAAGYDNLYQAYRRAKALSAFSKEQGFRQVLEAFTRAANILRKNPLPLREIREELLAEPAEKALHTALRQAAVEVDKHLAEEHYQDALEEIGKLREEIDQFFTDVMVMAEDEDLKHNRLALLGAIVALTRDIADLSQIAG